MFNGKIMSCHLLNSSAKYSIITIIARKNHVLNPLSLSIHSYIHPPIHPTSYSFTHPPIHTSTCPPEEFGKKDGDKYSHRHPNKQRKAFQAARTNLLDFVERAELVCGLNSVSFQLHSILSTVEIQSWVGLGWNN